MIHLQPLPLLRPRDLPDQFVTRFSDFLASSLIALSLSLKSYHPWDTVRSEAAEHHSRHARDTVMKLALQGAPRVDVCQSLCLLVLMDIHGKCCPIKVINLLSRYHLRVYFLACRPQQAQMTLALASRLEGRRNSRCSASQSDQDLYLRCYWSVRILERLFSPHRCVNPDDDGDLSFPSAVAAPPPLPLARQEEVPPDLYNGYDTKQDLGITAYYIRIALLSGRISSWLHHVRLGKPETPWSPESMYAKLVARVYECDSQLPSKHLLRNVAFSKRSPEEVLEQREYWVPWVLMEAHCHACLSILNHPFIHLVASKQCAKGPQSGMFLQQTIDSALFNSGWFFRFLRICDGHQLDIWDPALGHLVAAVASIPWLMQFVRDERVSRQAVEDLAWSKAYLTRMATVWPHLSRKVCLTPSLAPYS